MASAEFHKLVEYMKRNAVANPTVEGMRAGIDAVAQRSALPEGLVRKLESNSPVPAEWLLPPGHDDNLIVYFHGGGFVLGSLLSHRHVAAHLASAAGSRAMVFQYRLAPEHPYPAALEDCIALYLWLLSSGVVPEKIAFAGDSAGANLLLGTLVRGCGPGKLPYPAAAVLFSPTVDVASFLATGEAENTDPSIDAAFIAAGFRSYIGDAPARDPLISPLFAPLSALPPMMVQIAAGEVFEKSVTQFVDRCREAGVTVEFQSWPEMIHVWQWFVPRLPEARDALDQAGKYLRSAFAGQTSSAGKSGAARTP